MLVAMAHHAYFYAGDIEEGIQASLAFGERELELSGVGNPDIITLRYGLFPVEEARGISDIASRAPLRGEHKLITVATARIFHEAQNALLKVFEEPSPGTFLVLIVPSEGNIIPTLRSRLLPLPGTEASGDLSPFAQEFIKADGASREKMIAKLLDRAKSDKAEEKQAVRIEALRFAEDLMRATYRAREKKSDSELGALLADLNRLIPVLNERSAPLKPILEHLLITVPQGKVLTY